MTPEPTVALRRDVEQNQSIVEREVDEPDDQEEVVSDGEDSQEKGRERRRRVPREHGEREAIPNEAEHTEQAGNDRVDDKLGDDDTPLVVRTVVVDEDCRHRSVVHVWFSAAVWTPVDGEPSSAARRPTSSQASHETIIFIILSLLSLQHDRAAF